VPTALKDILEKDRKAFGRNVEAVTLLY